MLAENNTILLDSSAARYMKARGDKTQGAGSIQPNFPEISVQTSMDRFGPTGKVSKKRVHLLRWSSFPGRTGWNFGRMDRVQGSFSIDDGNGSENVSFKMNSRFSNLCRVYSNLLKMASAGEFPWSWFLEDRTQV